MTNKKIILTLFAALVVLLVYNVPFYKEWVVSRFYVESQQIQDEVQHLSVEDRMEARFGVSYLIEMTIKRMLSDHYPPNAVILLPPRSYVDKLNIKGGFEVPEPAVFYYFTGYRAVSKYSKDVYSADCALWIGQKQMRLKPKSSIDTILEIYKPYD